MTIAELREKCKSRFTRMVPGGKIPRDILIFSVMFLMALLSFGLGYLAGLDAGQGSIPPPERPAAAAEEEERVVASKSGIRYYFSWCSGAERISENNKVWFSSPAAAEISGYTLAAHCNARSSGIIGP
jgi:hypothetical protein